MSERKITPPPIPEEARAQTPPSRVEHEAIAMSRADEVMHVQSIAQGQPQPSMHVDATAREEASPARRASPQVRIRILALASGVLALVAAIALSWRSFHQAAAGGAQQNDPVETVKATKIIRGQFSGFSLLVDSQPAGAQVFVDGRPRGRTPSLMNLQCRLGSSIEIRLEKSGYETYRQTNACEGSAIVSVKPKLSRAK